MSVPASYFGSKRDWLADYLLDVRQLLHDASGNFFQDAELVSYINEARTTVCIDTGALRTLVVATLPAAQSAFPIGGVYQIPAGLAPPVGGVAPYTLVSGGGAAATCSVAQVPATVTVTAGGKYWQPPLVTFDGGTMTVDASISARAVLAGAGGAVSSVFVNTDNGNFKNAGITPAVVFTSVGQPAQLTVGSDGFLALASAGSGQSGGVFIQDSAGTLTNIGPVGILDASIASIDQVTCLWGSQRVPLRNYAYSDFKIATQGIIGFQSVPTAFSMYGDTLYLGPTPNQAYTYELDCIRYPSPLLDFHTMGEITDRSAVMCVKYYAAFRARMSQQDQEGAQAFFALYQERVMWSANRFTTRMSQLLNYNENLD